jgi:hypothetical protein
MYKHDGQNIFVIDGHMHFWDANPENWKNKHGESWIKCFYAYHSALSPADLATDQVTVRMLVANTVSYPDYVTMEDFLTGMPR